MKQPLRLLISSCVMGSFFFSCKDSGTANNGQTPADDTTKTEVAATVLNNDSDDYPAPDTIVVAPEKVYSLKQVYRRFSKKPSYFVINNSRDTVIKCKEGTLLSVPANAFLNASNQSAVLGEVKISVKEFYKISDILLAGLSTTSNHNVLESGGMVNIKATTNDGKDSLILKPGKNISIAMPKADSNFVGGMQLFNGMHDTAAINWVPRAGPNGMALNWTRRGYEGNFNFVNELVDTKAGMVFADGNLKVKPQYINTNPENLKTEIQLPISELVLNVGTLTKKANAYIDTLGNLHCYRMGDQPRKLNFNGIYSVSSIENIKVNVAVDVKLSYKSTINHMYYLKLFKMGKGKPDSLVNVTVNLNPVIKMTSYEGAKKILPDVITVKGHKKRMKNRSMIKQILEKRAEELHLAQEARLKSMEATVADNLENAQNYFLLSTTSLGWVNCDRFYNIPGPRVEYFVKLQDKASLLLVFNGLKAIVASDANGVFHNIPLNQKVTIVGLRTEEGKLLMACEETQVSDQPFEALTFKAVTMKEYKEKLGRLNGL